MSTLTPIEPDTLFKSESTWSLNFDLLEQHAVLFLVVLMLGILVTAVVVLWRQNKNLKSEKDNDQDYLTRKDFESFKEHHNARYREFKKENHDEHEGLEKKMDSQYNKIMEKLSELGEKIAELKGKVEK